VFSVSSVSDFQRREDDAVAALVHGHPLLHQVWGHDRTDPGARLVDGIWIGPQIACPPARDECGVISSGARAALSDAERSQVVQVEWVSLLPNNGRN
jgi:hypothetical protein